MIETRENMDEYWDAIVERDAMVAEIQSRIEGIEEELDRFNHNTVIEGV